MKKLLAVLLAMVLVVGLAACGNTAEPAPESKAESKTEAQPVENTEKEESKDTGDSGLDPDIKAALTFAAWDTTAINLYDSLDLEGRFQELYPNVTIEIEQSKDDSEYWDSMKIRASANQLPDIMFNKPFTLPRFSEYLYDLSDLEAVQHNTLVEGYKTDGKVLGIPEKGVGDYVFFWNDMFEEAGVDIPTTWEELIAVSKELQTHFEATDPDYSAIAIGAKDEWPTYPFTEFMPCLVSGNGQNWNTMAAEDEPFSSGTDIYVAYHKINDLFNAGVTGKDPLGIGHDQAVSLFGQKKASIIVAGPWAITTITEAADNIDTLETFYLPVRDSESDPFRTIVQGDNFMGVTTHSDNPELAKEFVKFYFSEAWYPDYITNIGDDSTMENFPKEKDPVLAKADEYQPDAEFVMYDGGGDDYSKIESEVKFDYKKLGAQMFVDGFDLDAEFDKLNEAWSSARTELGIN